MVYHGTIKQREYFTTDYDEAKSFERFYDGDFHYVDGGYVIKIS